MNPCSPLLAVAESGTKSLLSLSPVDLVIVVIYFAFCLGIGFYLKKYATTGEDFFMAGRKMTAWIAGLSFISANLSSLETMGWSAMAYQYGMLGAHAYLIGAIPAIVFLAVVMMPFYYVCKTHSVPGYLHLRYGNDSRVFSGISFTVMTVMVCGVNMFAMAKMLQLLLGWDMQLQHLGVLDHRGRLRGPGRPDLGHAQRGAAVLPHLAGHPAGADPRADRVGRLERHDGADHRAKIPAPNYTSLWAQHGFGQQQSRWACTGSAWSSASASPSPSATGARISSRCSAC